MPLIAYKCECGNSVSKFIRNAKEAPVSYPCTKCSKNLTKRLSAPSSTSTITIDNGIQARATIVNLDIVKDIRERSSKGLKDD